jgi:hypothetical protein
MMDARELNRRIDSVEAENRELRRIVANLADRIPTPTPPPRLIINHEHEEDEHGTSVYEVGIRKPSYLEDQWKIVTSARAKSPTDTADPKLALSIATVDAHDEGFVWGQVYYAWGTDGYQNSSWDAKGWGTLGDVLGIEEEGFRYVNIITQARFGNGKDEEDRKVGPIMFDDYEDNWKQAGGNSWLLGKMIFDGFFWRPAFQGGVKIESSKTAYVSTPPNLPKDHEDHCAVFWASAGDSYWPLKYVKLESFLVWAVTDGDKVNVHKVAACNRDDINEIWRHLAVLDWHAGDVMGWHDNWLDKMYTTGGIGFMGRWLASVHAWATTVDALLALLSGFHPTTATAYGNQLTAYQSETAYNVALLGQLPYVPECPLPAGHSGEYHNPSRLTCQQIEGS